MINRDTEQRGGGNRNGRVKGHKPKKKEEKTRWKGGGDLSLGESVAANEAGKYHELPILP